MRLQMWSESNPTRESTGIKVCKKIVQQKSNTCIEVQSYRIDLSLIAYLILTGPATARRIGVGLSRAELSLLVIIANQHMREADVYKSEGRSGGSH